MAINKCVKTLEAFYTEMPSIEGHTFTCEGPTMSFNNINISKFNVTFNTHGLNLFLNYINIDR